MSHRSKRLNKRIGIIGTGSRGLGLTNILLSFDGIAVTACCNIIPGNLSRAMALTDNNAKEIIDQNWLGKITHFECLRTQIIRNS